MAAHQKTKEALALVDQTTYFHSVSLAGLALRDNNVVLARQRLEECKTELRGWEWRYLYGQCHSELFSFHGSKAMFSPDGTQIAATGKDSMVRVYDVRTGQAILALQAMANDMSLLYSTGPVFSPDGARIAVRGQDRQVRVYDARTGQEAFVLKGPAGLYTPTFSPDGKRIAGWSHTGERGDGVVRVYDARTGQEALAIKAPVALFAPVFSPDGSRIAAHGKDRMVRVYDAHTGQEVLALKGPFRPDESGVSRFSPDGQRIVVTDTGGVVRVYDVRTGQESLALKRPASPGREVGNAVFSPDGARIAVGVPVVGGDDVLRVYDAQTGQESLALKSPAPISQPVFSPDGTRITDRTHITAEPLRGRGDGVVRVYDVRTGQEALALKGPARLGGVVFSPDGARIAVHGGDGLVYVHDARVGQESLALKGNTSLDSGVFSPDGTRIATRANDDVVRVYDAPTGQEILALKGPALFSGVVMFSPDGTQIATSGEDVVGRVYDARTGQETFALKPVTKERPFIGMFPIFSPDSTRIAFTGQDGVVRVYDARTGQEVFPLKGSNTYQNPLFSPDGLRIAASSQDGVVRVYDARTGQEALMLKGPAALWALRFSPDGSRIAASSGDRLVRVYDARTGQEVLALKGPAPLFGPLFSPDGKRIAAQSSRMIDGDGVVRLYDAQTGQEVLALKGPASLANPVFSPDGTRIAATADATSGGDGVVRLYDTRTGQEVLALKGPGELYHPEFSPDGTRIATSTLRNTLLVWEAPARIEDWQALRRERMSLGIAAWHRAEGEKGVSTRQWFAAAFHLRRLCDIEPGNGHHHLNRGQALMGLGRHGDAKLALEKALSLKDTLSDVERARTYAELGEWEEAANQFAKVVETRGADQQTSSSLARVRQQADQENRSALALLRLQLNDRASYSKACATLLEDYAKRRGFLTAKDVIRACVRVPGAVSDMAPLVDMARSAAQSQPEAWQTHSMLGAALYRAGNHEEAVAELTKAADLRTAGGLPFNILFLAMAHHGLGKSDEARKWLERAAQAIEKNPEPFWYNRLELRLLRAEAEALLKEPPRDPKK